MSSITDHLQANSHVQCHCGHKIFFVQSRECILASRVIEGQEELQLRCPLGHTDWYTTDQIEAYFG